MKVNFMKATIEITATESKTAGNPNSDKYGELIAIRAQFPGYRVEVVKATKKKGDGFNGLTFAKMEKYIKGHDSEGNEILKKFYELTGRDENGKKLELAVSASYGEVKTWFLSKYPEVDTFRRDIEKEVEEAKKIRAERKVA